MSTAYMDSYVWGNSDANIHQGGFIAENEKFIYYSNMNDDQRIYKVQKGSQETTKITKHKSYEINLVGNYIYYIYGSPGYIYRIKNDGTEEEKLTTKRCLNLLVNKDFMLYKEYGGKNGDLYIHDIKSNKRKMLKENIVEFSVNGNYIYFSEGVNCNLYKMDFYGNNLMKICDDYVSEITIFENYIYYTNFNQDDKLYRINQDGTNKTLISENACWNINIYKGYIYYRNQSDKGNIYKMKLDGSDNHKIIEGNCAKIHVIDDFMIFYRITEGSGYYKADLDGENVQLMN